MLALLKQLWLYLSQAKFDAVGFSSSQILKGCSNSAC
jgi:hypothetical protein